MPATTSPRIDQYINRPFKLKGNCIKIEFDQLLKSVPYCIVEHSSEKYIANIDNDTINESGFRWYKVVLGETLSGFISFEHIENNLIK